MIPSPCDFSAPKGAVARSCLLCCCASVYFVFSQISRKPWAEMRWLENEILRRQSGLGRRVLAGQQWWANQSFGQGWGGKQMKIAEVGGRQSPGPEWREVCIGSLLSLAIGERDMGWQTLAFREAERQMNLSCNVLKKCSTRGTSCYRSVIRCLLWRWVWFCCWFKSKNWFYRVKDCKCIFMCPAALFPPTLLPCT